MSRSIFTLILFLFTVILRSGAQNYPIQSTVLLTPPYTLNLPQYAVEPERISVQLLNKDFATPLVEVYLQIKIEGPGITLETKSSYRPLDPIALTAGIPLILNGNDLKDVLDANNLNFSGLDQYQFMAGGANLPEGLYKFSVVARTYHQNLQVSNIGYTTAGIFKHLPPIINLPLDNSFLTVQNPQYLQILFTPRHTVTPELVSRVRYKIKLIEVIPSGRNPNEAIQSNSLPFFETITDQTSFIYGPGEPAMTEGRMYAIQVQAIDVDGKNLFDNNGYSQVVSFVYGSQCPIPQNLKVNAGDGNSIDLQWDENIRYRSYVVYYKAKGQKNFKAELVFKNGYTLQSCLPASEYEIKVSGVCLENESEPTPTIFFKTSNTKTSGNDFAKNCGKPLPSIDLSNKQPLQNLQVGDTINAADFEIRITAINGANGIYSGAGLVRLPFTGKIPIPCTFNHILLNTEKRLINGKISLLQEPLELSTRTIVNAGKTWRTLFGNNWNRFSQLKYPGIIGSIEEDPNGDLILKGNSGTQKIRKGSNARITDANGKTWFISKAGKISEAEGPATIPVVKDIETGDGTPSSLPAWMAKLFFYCETKDAYDAVEIMQLTAGKTYDEMETADTTYYPGWKLLRAGDKYHVNAHFIQGKKIPCPMDSVRFVRSDGTNLPFTYKDNEFTITVTGRMQLYADAIWAIANYRVSEKSPSQRWILGKLNLINVDVRQQDIVLIPVNNVGSKTDAALIQAGLNQLYGAYGIQTSVTKDRNLNVKDYDAGTEILEADKTIINLGYSKKLERFIEAYKADKPHLTKNYSNDTSYIFLLNKSTAQTRGFMSPGEQFGFIFLNGEQIPDIHTIAHEMGHGAFSLEHTFGTDLSRSAQSQNLMDYAAPYALLNYDQWIQIHDPEIDVSGFQNEDKGKYVSISRISQFKELANEDGTYTFISHSGEYITLPAYAENLVFSTLNRGYYAFENGVHKPSDNMFPLGCLTAFRIQSIDYHARVGKGYVDAGDTVYNGKWESSKFSDGIMVYVTFNQNSYTGKAAKFSSSLKQKTDTKTGEGPSLNSFAVIDFEPASLSVDFEAYMNGRRKGEKKIEKLDMRFGIFGNDHIEFNFRDTGYNASKFLIKILSEQRTVSDYIYYFNLVNLRKQDYYSFVECLNDKADQKAIQIKNDFILKRNTEKGEYAAVSKYVNSDKENLFAELYKVQMKDFVAYTSNGSALSQNIKKAIREKWTPEYLYEHLKSANHPRCHYTAIELEDRIYVIDALIRDADHWSYDDVDLMACLLGTTPQYDIKELLKKGVMANKFNWLFQFWYNRDDADIGTCFEIINDWYFEHYDALEITPSKGKLIAEDIPGLNLEYDKSQNEFLIGIKEKTLDLEIIPQKYSIYCNSTFACGSYFYSSNPGEVTFREDGTILFTQTYRVDDISPQLFNPLHPPFLRSVVDFEEVFNPFELMSVTVGGNYFALGIKAGQTMEMPAFMVMQMQEKLQQQVEDEQTHKLVNKVIIGVSLIAAVYTNGASLDVASGLMMATLSADNAMMDYKSSIKTQAEWDANKEFFHEWDALNTAAQYALTAVDVRSLGKVILPKVGSKVSFIKRWNLFRKKYKNYKGISKEVDRIITEIIEETKAIAPSVTQRLTKLEKIPSSVKITWKNIDDKYIVWADPKTNVLSTAKSFADETGSTFYDAILNDNFYVKFDITDGRFLLGNTNGEYHAFAIIEEGLLSKFKSSVLNLSEDVFKTKLSEFLVLHADRLKIISGVTQKSLTIAGKIVKLSEIKVNTILGRFKPDIKSLFSELGSYKSVGLGENAGGVNMLNRPDQYTINYSTGRELSNIEWWNKWNKDWLERSISRKDDIYLATIYTDKLQLIDKMGNYKNVYAFELNHLVKRNYKPVNISDVQWELIKSWF